ncbi:hypothetical protein [Litchfieldia alkalitelluris]|uniref:hypothetical protein n=1 Tax=Litchfieldia alkalitelluris TaxID=304268 RepID=UPI000998871F|nr:hypothetical protein [Litchfieldia alkalitelluris]
MSVQHYHGLCQRYRGRAVKITTRDGRIQRGIIQHVDHQNVYIKSFGGTGATRHLGGFGYGFYGYGGYGYGGYGTGVALGAITALALLPFFW